MRLHRPADDLDAAAPDDSRDGSPDDSDDLPRRVRQASLAPQLRERATEKQAPASALRDDYRRTPELVRDRMAAYRDGWARGGGRRPGHGATPDFPAGSDSIQGDLT